MAHENNKDNPAAISKTKIFRWSVFLLIFSVIVVINTRSDETLSLAFVELSFKYQPSNS